jgi:plastocyanin
MRAVWLLPLCLAVTGCGGAAAKKPASTPAATATATPAVVEVDMRHNRFRPHRIVVRPGQTVKWLNRDAVAHTVASQDLHLSSEAIQGGETYTYRARRTGTFAYFCTIHAGQTGVLVVAKAPG